MQRPTQAIFASVIRNPKDARVLAGLGFLHLVLAYVGFSGWRCPIFLATGVPCPGCGLTRGTAALLRGDWKAMVEAHLFAPVFLGAAVITGITALVPETWRKRIIDWIEKIEGQTQIALLIIISLFVYWGLRLGLQADLFITLMKSTY
jgi:hypothetical protein